jgi:hypothetical protein
MPGDILAMATTFSTVVRDGPNVCKAEMHASISRWRWRLGALRARETLSAGAGAAFFFRELKRGRGL